MGRIFQGILANAPLWVWPLFLALVLFGLISTRTRNSPVILYAILPFLGLLALGSVGGLPFQALGWSIFGPSYLAGLWLGNRLQKRWIIARMGRKIRVKGEGFTLVVLITIFAANFADGIFSAILPDLRLDPVYTILFAAIVGVISGSFLGRAICVLRSKPSAAPAP
ncbi:MAG: hypothetical protein ACRBBK_12280 [Paracoccaceae bacterium]